MSGGADGAGISNEWEVDPGCKGTLSQANVYRLDKGRCTELTAVKEAYGSERSVDDC